MKHQIFIFLTIAIISFLGCGEEKLTQEEIEDTKQEIRDLITKQGKAYASGNMEYFKNSVSDDILEFGTSKNGVATNKEEWIEAFRDDFKALDTMNIDFSEKLRHLSIQVSETGDMASAIFEAPYTMTYKEKQFPGLFRMAVTWRKENGEWKIVQWLAAYPVDNTKL
jgi:ketosteroid isomerase-like protein